MESCDPDVSGHHKPGFMAHLEMWHLWKGGMPAGGRCVMRVVLGRSLSTKGRRIVTIQLFSETRCATDLIQLHPILRNDWTALHSRFIRLNFA